MTMSSIASMNTPQCHSFDGEGDENQTVRLKLHDNVAGRSSKIELQIDDGEGADACIQLLSDDVLFNMFLYCGPTDVDESLNIVNRRFQ